MNTFFVAVCTVLVLLQGAHAQNQIGSCATPNMTAVFKTTSQSVIPVIPARNVNWTFTLNGNAAVPLSGVTALISTSVCIQGTCIPVDQRTIPCSNPSGCNFPAGPATIQVQQLIPSFTPAGQYQSTLGYTGTANGSPVSFACFIDSFTLN